MIFTGPLAKDDPRWLELLEKDAQACGYPHAQPGEVGDDLAALLGESGAAGVPLLTPLAPDLLAEAFAVSVLVKRHFQRWKWWCNAPHRMAGAISCAPPWIRNKMQPRRNRVRTRNPQEACKWFGIMEPAKGIEPPTYGLRNRCSTD